MKITAIIFDLDGTIIDSEPIYYKADKKFLSRYGIDFSEEDQKEFIGAGNWNFLNVMRKRYNITGDPHEMIKEKNKIYLDLARKEVEVYPEMEKLIKILHSRNLPLAVASGSTQVIIEELIEVVQLGSYFDHLYSSEHVSNDKPAPDVFLETAKLLGVEPNQCLVLEDSVHGVNAAKAAGMFCAAMPAIPEAPLHPDYGKADLLFKKGMKEFSSEKVLAWFDEHNNLN